MVPGPGEPPEVLQQYLQLLAEAYRRTHALASKLQPIEGSDCNTAVGADTLLLLAYEYTTLMCVDTASHFRPVTNLRAAA